MQTQPLLKMNAIEIDDVSRNFELVVNKKDWRAPIDTTLPFDILMVLQVTPTDLVEAVRFFTATEASLELVDAGRAIRIRAVGYRAGPAGP